MESDPYTPPESSSRIPGSKTYKFAILSLLLYAGPIWGKIGATITMIRALNLLQDNSDSSYFKFHEVINESFIYAIIGLALGLLGTILILIEFFHFKNRNRSFFWAVISLSFVWGLLSFPYGLVIAIPMTFIFMLRRTEFFAPDIQKPAEI